MTSINRPAGIRNKSIKLYICVYALCQKYLKMFFFISSYIVGYCKVRCVKLFQLEADLNVWVQVHLINEMKVQLHGNTIQKFIIHTTRKKRKERFLQTLYSTRYV